jgi:Ca2+:H+ antiporter
MAVAFSAARKDRLDMSVSIALGSASGTRAHQLRCRSETNGLAALAGRGDDGDDFCCHGILHFEQRPLGMVYRRFAIIILFIYAIFAITLYVVPPGAHAPA